MSVLRAESVTCVTKGLFGVPARVLRPHNGASPRRGPETSAGTFHFRCISAVHSAVRGARAVA